jgi:hypothetical protein
MPDRASTGLRYLPKLLTGFDELQWLQDELQGRDGHERLGLAFEPGWVGGWGARGADNLGWDIVESGGQLTTRSEFSGPGAPYPSNRLRDNTVPFLGIDPQGRRLEVDPDELLYDEDGLPITVPNDGVWYTLIARFFLDVREPGEITLTGGSVTITGSRTKFLRHGDGTDVRATRIRIDASDGVPSSAGFYRFATITSDTTATLTTAPPVSGTVRYRVAGNFYAATPADPDCHYTPRVAWELVTRTVARPADALIAYDVRRSGGTLSRIDRRHAQSFRIRRPEARHVNVAWPLTRTDYDGVSVPFIESGEAAVYEMAANEICRRMQLTGCRAGARITDGPGDLSTAMLLALTIENTSTGVDRLICKEYTPLGDPSTSTTSQSAWYNPGGSGAEVVIVSATGLLGAALCSLPRACGNSHIAFYTDSNGTLWHKTSTDDGQSWSAATSILNPAGLDAIGQIDATLTRLGRLIVVFEYRTSGGDYSVRFVYSDDLGATWQTNGTAGFTLLADAGTNYECPKCREDSEGNLWTIAIRKGAVQEIRMVRGQSVNNPIPDGTEAPAAGWKVSWPSSASFTPEFCDLVPTAQAGELLVFYQWRSVVGPGNSVVTVVAHVSMGRLLRTRILLRSRGAGTAYADPMAFSCAYNNGGQLMMVYSADDSVAEHNIKSVDLEVSYTERPVCMPYGN